MKRPITIDDLRDYFLGCLSDTEIKSRIEAGWNTDPEVLSLRAELQQVLESIVTEGYSDEATDSDVPLHPYWRQLQSEARLNSTDTTVVSPLNKSTSASRISIRKQLAQGLTAVNKSFRFESVDQKDQSDTTLSARDLFGVDINGVWVDVPDFDEIDLFPSRVAVVRYNPLHGMSRMRLMFVRLDKFSHHWRGRLSLYDIVGNIVTPSDVVKRIGLEVIDLSDGKKPSMLADLELLAKSDRPEDKKRAQNQGEQLLTETRRMLKDMPKLVRESDDGLCVQKLELRLRKNFEERKSS